MADRMCQIGSCTWQGIRTVTLRDGTALAVCVEHHLRFDTPTSRLGWWEKHLASRLTADSDYQPKPGEELHTRQFRLVEVTP